MNDEWFTEIGATGELLIDRRDDGWFVTSPGEIGKTKCLVDYIGEDQKSKKEISVDIEVDNFRVGVGSNMNFLFATNRSDEAKKRFQTDSKTPDQKGKSGRDWVLDDFRASGKYVNTTAKISGIRFVKKDVPNMPYMKGRLTDDSVSKSILFVMGQKVPHPKLSKGNWYRFTNIKDHHYIKKNEMQALITEKTHIEKL